MELKDELAVDDIPFNTTEISSGTLNQFPPVKTILDDEAYIDDIPFNTSVIASNAINQGLIKL